MTWAVDLLKDLVITLGLIGMVVVPGAIIGALLELLR